MAGPNRPRRIIFIHPDLGIGGAERLVVDAAVGLQELGHRVTIFTSHCDQRHCFEEVRDGTLDVRVRGDGLFPSTILSRFHILLATLRQIHLLLSTCLFSSELTDLKPDVFVVDQLSACVPLLRWLWPRDQRVLFYCHFPDQLLAGRDESGLLGMMKGFYRLPFDWFEAWSMAASDQIVVNSMFTKSVVERVFGQRRLGKLKVIYPCVNTEADTDNRKETPPVWADKKILLSINRYERKKDVGLAIKAFGALTPNERSSVRLVIAGGYDPRVAENVQYHQELESLGHRMGLSHATAKTVPTALAIPSSIEILFLLSVPSSFKSTLLQNAKLLVYTPSNEHFGIVPVEAMQHGTLVLAANTGGPLETVIDGVTGFLKDVNEVAAWTEVMRYVLNDNINTAETSRMAQNGRQRVGAEFSRTKMAHRFERIIVELSQGKRSGWVKWKDLMVGLGAIAVIFIAWMLGIWKVSNQFSRQYEHLVT